VLEGYSTCGRHAREFYLLEVAAHGMVSPAQSLVGDFGRFMIPTQTIYWPFHFVQAKTGRSAQKSHHGRSGKLLERKLLER
jgi:hypothetical protein